MKEESNGISGIFWWLINEDYLFFFFAKFMVLNHKPNYNSDFKTLFYSGTYNFVHEMNTSRISTK
jgi:hypothetical protein